MDHPSAISGIYTVDPDGAGGTEPFPVECDMETDGGGWTLVLDYLHAGGTNPELMVRDNNLPVLGLHGLGLDESGSATWGHASRALMDAFSFSELRFFGITSAHTRTIHFRTDDPSCVLYFSNIADAGSCIDIGSHFTALAGHDAILPNGTGNAADKQADFAMTEFPFFKVGANHWGIRGSGSRWEVDDSPESDAFSTLHRIYIR